MSIGSFSVRPEQVTALSESIGHGADGIAQKLSDLEREVGHLREQWNGEAQQAYDQAQQRWNRDLDDVRNILSRIASATAEISGGYTDSDQRSAKFFG